MCGIAGYIGPSPPDPSRVAACRAVMRRRGPDADGLFEGDAPDGRKVCLIHSRLSIIDLDHRADQPLHDSGKVIVFNGELYNFIEIRRELTRQGERFETESDTEVLLKTLNRYGMDGLDRCEGMWGFAYYDQASGELFLCRDRFSEKPLYYLEHDGGLYFGSEIKFIAALRGDRLTVNSDQVARYLALGYRGLNMFSETFFEGVRQVSAGTYVHIVPGRPSKTKAYWEPRIEIDERMSFEDAVAGVRDHLTRSVALRLRADVPLAFCMSGGVDSNGLVSIAHQSHHHAVHAFTIVNKHERYAEQDMVDQSIRAQGLTHTAITLDTDGFPDRFRALTAYHDAPVYTLTSYVHWLLMGAVKDHGYKIAISGTGADELVSGYYDHHLFYLAEIQQEGAAYDAALAAWRQHVRPGTLNPLLQDHDAFIRSPDNRDHLVHDGTLMDSVLTRRADNGAFREMQFLDKPLRNRMLNELFVETVPPPLHEEDLNAMYFSVENRAPYLDRDLFEFCYSIPTRHLIQDGRAKAVLRAALRGLVPDSILDNRRKVGLNAPLYDLLDRNSPDVRESLLDDGPVFDFVDRGSVEDLMQEPNPDHASNLFLFYFLSTKIFLEEYGA